MNTPAIAGSKKTSTVIFFIRIKHDFNVGLKAKALQQAILLILTLQAQTKLPEAPLSSHFLQPPEYSARHFQATNR